MVLLTFLTDCTCFFFFLERTMHVAEVRLNKTGLKPVKQVFILEGGYSVQSPFGAKSFSTDIFGIVISIPDIVKER